MQIQADVKVNFRNKYVKDRGSAFVEDMALGLGVAIQEGAQHNVRIGVGPGPHPHVTKHEDTGQLEASIQVEVRVEGEHAVATVGTDEMYGQHLEAGWHSADGAFHRYPWLWPATKAAQEQVKPQAAQKARVHFEDGSGGRIGLGRTSEAVTYHGNE